MVHANHAQTLPGIRMMSSHAWPSGGGAIIPCVVGSATGSRLADPDDAYLNSLQGMPARGLSNTLRSMIGSATGARQILRRDRYFDGKVWKDTGCVEKGFGDLDFACRSRTFAGGIGDRDSRSTDNHMLTTGLPGIYVSISG